MLRDPPLDEERLFEPPRLLREPPRLLADLRPPLREPEALRERPETPPREREP
jgi:hypothetical protein